MPLVASGKFDPLDSSQTQAQASALATYLVTPLLYTQIFARFSGQQIWKANVRLLYDGHGCTAYVVTLLRLRLWQSRSWHA